jgi:hypothetical protein
MRVTAALVKQHAKPLRPIILSSVACLAIPHCHKQHDFRKKKIYIYIYISKVIHKSLRDFRPLRYSGRDGHAEGEHVNRGRVTLSFCPTLQVLDMCTLCDAADVNPVIKFPATRVATRLPRHQGCIRVYRAPVR